MFYLIYLLYILASFIIKVNTNSGRVIVVPARILQEYEFYKLKHCSLGERVKFFREQIGILYSKKDFTTKAISERIDVTPQSITAIERGDSKNPSYHLIHKLTNDLNIPFDSLTDEFYQNEVKLFQIGFLDNKSIVESVTNTNFSKSHFGCYVYQLFSDGKMRFVYNKESDQLIDSKKFIATLSRSITEIELLNQKEDMLKQTTSSEISPLQHAKNLIIASIESPHAFPKIPKDEWLKSLDRLFNQYGNSEDEATNE